MQRIEFTQDGVEYVMIVTEFTQNDLPFYNIVIRRKDNDAFVKAWAGQSKEFVDQRVRLAREGSTRLVLKRDLTALRVLEYIEQYLALHGEMPLYRTMAQALSLEHSNILTSINYLVEHGFLRRVPHVPRGTTLLKRRADL